jgi:hypothetical protein
MTETSTLLPKSPTPTNSGSSILATILDKGYKCLTSAKPDDDTIFSIIQDWQEVTKATQQLGSPQDKIKSQLVSPCTRQFLIPIKGVPRANSKRLKRSIHTTQRFHDHTTSTLT